MFLGNSLGCQVIIDLAVRYPELVDAAVLVGPTVDTSGHTMIQQLWRGFRDLVHEPWSLWRILARDYLRTGTSRMYRTFRFALQDDRLEQMPERYGPDFNCAGWEGHHIDGPLGRAAGKRDPKFMCGRNS